MAGASGSRITSGAASPTTATEPAMNSPLKHPGDWNQLWAAPVNTLEVDGDELLGLRVTNALRDQLERLTPNPTHVQ